MQQHALREGARAIQLKGNKLRYNTIQCTTGSCTGNYNYEGTARNPLFKVSEAPSVNKLTRWLHSSYVPERQEHFNQVVANVYARHLDMPVGSSEIEVRARPPRGVFRTMANALQPGWHIWETNCAPAGQDWRATGLSCKPTIH